MPEDTFHLGSHTVHRIGYGAMRLPGPGVWGPPNDRGAAVAVLRRAIELGVDHIDTAQYYGPDVANDLIRSALRNGGSYPEGLLIATKVGGRRGPDREWLPALTPAELRAAVHDNLRSLGLDRLGLVNLRLIGESDGMPDPGVPLSEMLGALIELRDQGLIEAIGISAVTVEQLSEARALTEVACVQNHLSLLDRTGADVLDACGELGIAFVPFFPLGGGDIVGTRQLLEHDGVRAVAARHGATPAQVALAWTLSLGRHVLAIPGTSSVAHLEENLAAGEIEFDEEDRSMLEA